MFILQGKLKRRKFTAYVPVCRRQCTFSSCGCAKVKIFKTFLNRIYKEMHRHRRRARLYAIYINRKYSLIRIFSERALIFRTRRKNLTTYIHFYYPYKL